MSKSGFFVLRVLGLCFVLISNTLIHIPVASAAIYSFSTFTFTSCGATGKSGPTLAQCQSTYGTSWSSNASYFNVSSGIQTWVAPATGQYQITAAGAAGAGASSTAGRGAIIRATVSLTQGATYKILVGQGGMSGNQGGANSSGGGGGGTFFTDNSNTPIIVAGGGAGLYQISLSNPSVANGQTTTSGAASSDSYGTAGTNGGGGGGATGAWGSGGGGLTGNGTQGANCTGAFGYAFTNGGAGGTSCTSYNAHGGFGGGGGTHGYTGGGGGGGGYSGGGGSSQATGVSGGGGGSFILASATNRATSNGSYAGSSTGITNLNDYNGTYQAVSISNGYLTIQLLLDPVTVSVGAVSGNNAGTYRSATGLTATLSAAGGKVTFYARGKVIPNCRNLYTATTTVTCNWSPAFRGTVPITAKVVPDNGAAFSPSPATYFLVGNRAVKR